MYDFCINKEDFVSCTKNADHDMSSAQFVLLTSRYVLTRGKFMTFHPREMRETDSGHFHPGEMWDKFITLLSKDINDNDTFVYR